MGALQRAAALAAAAASAALIAAKPAAHTQESATSYTPRSQSSQQHALVKQRAFADKGLLLLSQQQDTRYSGLSLGTQSCQQHSLVKQHALAPGKKLLSDKEVSTCSLYSQI